MARWVAFVSVSVGECQSEDSFVCFRVKRRWGKARFQGSQQKKAVIRRGQSTEEDSQQKSGESDGQRKATAKREVETCRLRSQVSQREWMSQRSWWLCRNFARTYARDSQMHRKPHKSVINFSLLALGANLSPCLFVLLFFYPLACVCCVLCVCKAMWNAPGQKWEKPLDDRMAMSLFRRLR